MTIAERIKKVMMEKEKSAMDVSRVSGISPSVMSRYVNGKRVPTVENLVKIADALGVDVGILAGQHE